MRWQQLRLQSRTATVQKRGSRGKAQHSGSGSAQRTTAPAVKHAALPAASAAPAPVASQPAALSEGLAAWGSCWAAAPTTTQPLSCWDRPAKTFSSDVLPCGDRTSLASSDDEQLHSDSELEVWRFCGQHDFRLRDAMPQQQPSQRAHYRWQSRPAAGHCMRAVSLTGSRIPFRQANAGPPPLPPHIPRCRQSISTC